MVESADMREVPSSSSVGSPAVTHRRGIVLRLNLRQSALQGPPTMKSLSCPNRHCPPSRKGDFEPIIRHGFYKTRWGKRRRYRCQACETFSSTNGTPYYRLQHQRATFDEV